MATASRSQTRPLSELHKSLLGQAATQQRFWRKVEKTGECWRWQGGQNGQGYGRFYLTGGQGCPVYLMAHRVAFFLSTGSEGGRECLDHLCRNRGCVRPSHLEEVTRVENTRRGYGCSAINARKVTCPYGHVYGGDNLRIAPNGRVTQRKCRACQRARSQDWSGRKKGLERGWAQTEVPEPGELEEWPSAPLTPLL